MNETNQEIWAGDYDPIMGLLTNIHTVDLELMSQKTCSLNLKMSLKEKQDFVYQFGNGHKIKHQEVKCKLSGSTAEEQYKNWMSDMNEPLSAPNYGIENYFKLKQLDIPIQHEKVKQPFMTQVRSIPGRDLIIGKVQLLLAHIAPSSDIYISEQFFFTNQFLLLLQKCPIGMDHYKIGPFPIQDSIQKANYMDTTF